jgi:hypothetical protein
MIMWQNNLKLVPQGLRLDRRSEFPSLASAHQGPINIVRAVATRTATPKSARLKLLEIRACDVKATPNRNSYVPLRPQRTDELGADPDTAIYYFEPPWRLLFFC